MRAIEPLDRSAPSPAPIPSGGTLAAYVLIGLVMFAPWSQSPELAIPLLAGAGIGAAGTIALFVLGLRLRHRPICLRRLDICLAPRA